MIWHKSWLETRWRFLIGLAVLACSVLGVILARPEVLRLMPLADSLDFKGEIGRKIQEAVVLSREYRGYVWLHWFAQNLVQMGTAFAILLGTAGLLPQSSAVLFTLSMPLTRTRLLGVRAATGLLEWLVLACVPTLLIPLFSPSIGERYSFPGALLHGACTFVAGAAFFSLAFLLSTIFDDVWRPLLLTLLVAIVLALAPQAIHGLEPYSVFRVMSGEEYFRTGHLPWLGLVASAAASAAMLYGAAVKLARRDF